MCHEQERSIIFYVVFGAQKLSLKTSNICNATSLQATKQPRRLSGSCLALFLLPFCILTTRESQAHQKKTTANDAWLFADCDWLIFHKRRRKKRVQNNNNAFFPKNIFVSGWLTRGCVAYNIYISGLDFLFGYLAVWKFLDMTS